MKFKDFLLFAVLVIVGLLLGKIVNDNWQQNVDKEVKQVLSKVVMIDVPPIDTEVAKYLSENTYQYNYFTAIDIASGDYGIYEINHENNSVAAYAHGKCVSVGKARPGIYEIVNTASHLDYHDVRYWHIVNLKEIGNENNKVIVSSSGYEISEGKTQKKEDDGSLGNVQIDSEIMLTVYDNSVPGIILMVVDGGQ